MKIGFVGWRGMVGSVLMRRLAEENDFEGAEWSFFTTSNAGGEAPQVSGRKGKLIDAGNIETLADQDVILTCQGGDYTSEIHPKLRAAGFNGYWIDAASTLRMREDSVIVLDPVNREVIDTALEKGIRDYIGGNCTTSLMLMALHGLYRENLVEWISSMTYQAASGAGAKNMNELLDQMKVLGNLGGARSDASILETEALVTAAMRESSFPTTHFGAPLAGSLIPWIDRLVED
ncbi:MAG: aspartate-semialdehyde dehydrogenase, partial [Planctomycetes bacterium]|nr:aspartate-semialdehyde dehydrogenase [Planctomycetota bacterium]